jgi:hypothetical protein
MLSTAVVEAARLLPDRLSKGGVIGWIGAGSSTMATAMPRAADGSSDYCPIQLSYPDTIPTANPSLTVFNHTPVVPDAPGTGGLGESANQHSQPQVERSGALDISFLASPVTVDKPGQFVDNPDPADLLPRPCSAPPTSRRWTTARPAPR